MNSLKDISISTKKLYPTGRAWKYATGDDTPIEKQDVFTDGEGNIFTDGEGGLFGTVYNEISDDKLFIKTREKAIAQTIDDVLSIKDQLIADSADFTLQDIINWERVYGFNNSSLTQQERISILFNRMSYPNGKIYRQTASHIQEMLQNEGFNLFVHENRFWDGSKFDSINPLSSKFGGFVFGGNKFGNTGISFNGSVQNKISDEPITGIYGDKYNCIIFIGGETFPNYSDVYLSRKNELRELILKLKPLHSIVVLLINWI